MISKAIESMIGIRWLKSEAGVLCIAGCCFVAEQVTIEMLIKNIKNS